MTNRERLAQLGLKYADVITVVGNVDTIDVDILVDGQGREFGEIEHPDLRRSAVGPDRFRGNLDLVYQTARRLAQGD